ncbi:uncharacterized protein LOC109861874 [Pseudomyrmex gracilis]|uniref:uncharacterized protein LOC109861874 n=1 Tax=Pseudomyrmex gracilis TaxID=219809 RepID=UPI000995BD04|nr:uncharacterized protein LOC109861874 [Pseudomyrmex gracilis]
MRSKDAQKRCSYSKENVELALTAINSGMKIAVAASKFGIPRSTLVSKKYKKYSEGKPGPATILTEEEEDVLVQWLFHCSKKGFPLTKTNLIDSVQLFVKKLNQKNSFMDNRLGRHWFEGFMRRHKNVSQRLAENLTFSRAIISETGLRKWFDEVLNYLKDKNLTNIDPSRIFNGDETCFLLNPKGGPVLIEKGTKNAYNIVDNNEKESISVLIMGNATGQLAPPLIILLYKRIPSYINTKLPQGWAVGRSESGWMTGEIFFEYIANTFHNRIIKNNIPRPILLFLDGHTLHLTMPLSYFCSANGIEVIALKPNSTHILQPMDVALFGPLKCSWKKK